MLIYTCDIGFTGTLSAETSIFPEVVLDDAVGTIPLPFDFPFYCNVHAAGTPLYVTTNGFLTFDNTGGILTSFNVDLKNLLSTECTAPGATCAPPGGLIAPVWDDLFIHGGVFGRGVFYSTWTAQGSSTPSVLIISGRGFESLTFGTVSNLIAYQVWCYVRWADDYILRAAAAGGLHAGRTSRTDLAKICRHSGRK